MASSVTREVFVVDEMRPTPTKVFEVGQIHYLPRELASNDEGGDTGEQAMNDEESG